MRNCDSDGQLMLFDPEPADELSESAPRHKIQAGSLSALAFIPYFHLDLSMGNVNLFGCHYWEFRSPWRESGPHLNTGPAPREPIKCALSEILESNPSRKYYLSKTACLGILRRAEERGKALPPQLKTALMAQAGLAAQNNGIRAGSWLEVLDQSSENASPAAFAVNQREGVRDLHNTAGAVQAQPGMKQQTFIAENCLNPWDTQQARVLAPEGKTTPLAAGFCAGAAPTAGGIGYQEEVSPTLKASESGTNMVPSVLCLNDQGGSVMECSEDVAGTLRAQEHGHQPLVFDNHGQDTRFQGPVVNTQTISASFGEGGNNQPLVLAAQQGGTETGAGVSPVITAAAGMSGSNQPVLFENHGIDARYKGPLPVAPTLPARAGTGGNNLSLIAQAGNAAVFSRQRVDIFKDNDVVSTESARQHKDATDLVYQETVGALTSSDRKGPNSQYVGQDKLVVDSPLLIRRLTPLECERLQGFPPGWTDLPDASDSARYKALGNSVAIPCVEFIMRGISMAVVY